MNITLTGYPLIRLTAKQSLTIDGQRINQGEIFFLVASKSAPTASHLVRWNYDRCCWQCSCGAGCKSHTHIKQVSAYSAAHPYTATHATVPVIVKSAPVITEVEAHSMYIIDHKQTVWYAFPQEKWHCSCSIEHCKHIEMIQTRMQKEVETILVDKQPPRKVVEDKPAYRIVSTGTKRKRRDLLEEIEQKAEHKSTILGEINEIKERASHINGSSQGFSLMR